MQFTIKVASDNADVVGEGDGDVSSIPPMLNDIKEKVWNGEREGAIRDANGNRVGRWSLVTGDTE